MKRIIAAAAAAGAVLAGLQAPAHADTPTIFGSSVYQAPGQTFTQALAATDAAYGKPPALRVFYSGAPGAWTDAKLNTPGRTTIVSFKYSPKDVLAGKHDAHLRSWFASAPRDRDVFWCFYHEPENEIEDGVFTAADYRAAWRRIDGLADEAGNARLSATTILMDWTLTPASGRRWQDYYPGSQYVDVMAWDVYGFNEANSETMAAHNAARPGLEVARSQGKPYAVAELGVRDHANRPAMLRDIAKWMRNTAGARFVTYFDAYGWPEYALDGDEASARSWREAVTGTLFAGTPAMTTTAGPAAPTSTSIEWTTRVDPAGKSGWVSCASWTPATGGNFSEGPRRRVSGNPETITCTRAGLLPKTAYRARLKWWDAETGGTVLHTSNTVDQTTAPA